MQRMLCFIFLLLNTRGSGSILLGKASRHPLIVLADPLGQERRAVSEARFPILQISFFLFTPNVLRALVILLQVNRKGKNLSGKASLILIQKVRNKQGKISVSIGKALIQGIVLSQVMSGLERPRLLSMLHLSVF